MSSYEVISSVRMPSELRRLLAEQRNGLEEQMSKQMRMIKEQLERHLTSGGGGGRGGGGRSSSATGRTEQHRQPPHVPRLNLSRSVPAVVLLMEASCRSFGGS